MSLEDKKEPNKQIQKDETQADTKRTPRKKETKKSELAREKEERIKMNLEDEIELRNKKMKN